MASVAIACAAVLPVLPPAGSAASTTYTFDSTVEGGGFQNVIAVDPADGGLAVIGGDVSGFSRSTDDGGSWATSNRGVPSVSMRQVATVAFSPTNPSTIYAGVGYRGKQGGFLVSHDGGLSWTVRSTVPVFSGSDNPVAGIPKRHPRSTGSLIAVDADRSLLYAGTFDDGVMRSADGGATWSRIGLGGKYLRSLVMDPNDPDTLFAATYGNGVWRTTAASGAPGWVRLTNAPGVVEELAWVGSTLYAAAGPNGIFRVTNGGQAWTKLGGGSLPARGSQWTTIGGTIGCDGPILYAGSHPGGPWSVARSVDGGATWSSLSAATVRTTIGGPGGHPWWLAAKKATLMLGAKGYTAAQLVVLPPLTACGPERVLVAGRSGVWGTRDAGASWYPMVTSLGTTITHAVAADPTDADRVSIGVADWAHLFSTDATDHVAMSLPTGVTNAYDVEFDRSTSPSGVVIGVGDPNGNYGGEVFSSTDPLGGVWVDEGISGPAFGRRILGVAAGTTAAGARVLLAATSGGGVWRKVEGGSWTQASSTAMSTLQNTKRASFAWPDGSSTVYLYDRQTGVWRSNDAGASWVKIWAQPSPIDSTGFVAAADGDPSTLYVSVADKGVYRIEGATSGTVGAGLTATPIGPTAKSGPIAVAGDLLVTARVASASGPAELYASTDRGVTWTPIADGRYASAALNPRDVDIAADGTIYVALNGAGMLRGSPGV
jgi:hypothetical protein